MAHEHQRLWLTFNAQHVNEPIICEMVRQFDIIFNIRNASVKSDIGIVALELEGERDIIKAAIKWLEDKGVQVEPVEINTIEG